MFGNLDEFDVIAHAFSMFEFYISDTLIGHSKLESGDPGMGVAQGKFKPTKEFSIFNNLAVQENVETRRWYNVLAKTPSGQLMKCSAISLAEYDITLTPTEPDFYLEIACLGIENPPYEELFPHHVRESEDRLKSGH